LEEHHDRLPLGFNLQSVLKEIPFSLDLNFQTISVDIFVISGHTATAVTLEPNVFYDSEVVAIIHRAKGNSGQLVSNKLWLWQGRNANFGEREKRKAKELAERFGTTAVRFRLHLKFTLNGFWCRSLVPKARSLIVSYIRSGVY